jgi:GGDEF domain-containing protein
MFAVDEAGLEMISIKDAKRLLTIIATAPAAILGAEGSLLRVKSTNSKRFQTAATFGLDDREIRDYFLPLEKETVMEVLRRNELVAREFSEEASPYIRSVLSAPVVLDGAVAGVITFFNKTTEGTVYPSRFAKTDIDILQRFMVYAQKGFANIMRTAEVAAGQPRPDEPRVLHRDSPMQVLERRVDEELNRSRRHDKGLVLVTLRIAGLKDTPIHSRAEFEDRLINFVRRRTRSFDIIVSLDSETFAFLFLDTNDRILRLFDAISEVISSEDTLNRALADERVEILYGHASFPADGDSFNRLYAKASERVRLDISKGLESHF